jgi:hypothetical protein
MWPQPVSQGKDNFVAGPDPGFIIIADVLFTVVLANLISAGIGDEI